MIKNVIVIILINAQKTEGTILCEHQNLTRVGDTWECHACGDEFMIENHIKKYEWDL